MPEKLTKLEKAAVEFRSAVRAVLELEGDTETDSAKLAPQLTTARETVEIAARRLVSARATDAAERSAALNAEALKIESEAAKIEEQAEHVDRTGEGTVRALYGDVAASNIVSTGRRTLKGDELRSQAAALQGRADSLKVDAKSTEAQPAQITKHNLTLSNLDAMQLALSLENVLDALKTGRLEV